MKCKDNVIMPMKVPPGNGNLLPGFFDDFFKPWNGWFINENNEMKPELQQPAISVIEDHYGFEVALAVPGMDREDFTAALEGNMLTISCERKDKSFSYSRNFLFTGDIEADKMETLYENGILRLILPRKEQLNNPGNN